MDVLHDRLIWQVLSGGHAFLPQGRITERRIPLTRSAPLRTPWGAAWSFFAPYSPECVEGEFSEVELPLYGVLRSSRSPDPFGPSLPKSHSLSCDLAAPVWCRGSWCAPRSREPLSGLRLRARPDARRPLPRSARRSPRWGTVPP